jgi:hypothetical protein
MPSCARQDDDNRMFDFYQGRPSFLPVHRYGTPMQLLADLSDRVIGPAEAKGLELRAIPVAPSPTR